MGNGKDCQAGHSERHKTHDKQAADGRPPDKEERVEPGRDDAGDKGGGRKVFSLVYYLRAGAEHADAHPDNHPAADDAEEYLHGVHFKKPGKTEIDEQD